MNAATTLLIVLNCALVTGCISSVRDSRMGQASGEALFAAAVAEYRIARSIPRYPVITANYACYWLPERADALTKSSEVEATLMKYALAQDEDTKCLAIACIQVMKAHSLTRGELRLDNATGIRYHAVIIE